MTHTATEHGSDNARLPVIIEAATRLFGDRGFAATGIRDIAKSAGITTATLYHYMQNKDDLLFTLMMDCHEKLCAPVADIADEVADPVERLGHLVRNHVQFHCASAPLAKVADIEMRALSGDMRQRAVAARDTYEGVWLQTLLDGAARGDFNIDNPRRTAQALLGMCTSVYTWYSPDGPSTVRAIAEDYRLLAMRLCEAKNVPQP
jgi:AcrR family transcriptional regulator